MKKNEMSIHTLKERNIFIQKLAYAGWEVESWDEVFDTGANVEPEAEARYTGPIFDLHLEFHADHRYLALEMVERKGENTIFLRLYPRGEIETLLALIIANQDNIGAENYPEVVKSLIPYCEPLLIDTDKGFFRLS